MTTITLAEEIKLENPKKVFSVYEFLWILKENWYELNNDLENVEDLDFKFTPYEKLTSQQQEEYDEVDLIHDSELYNI